MWHGSSDAEPEHVDHIPDPYLQLWTDEKKQWAGRLSPENWWTLWSTQGVDHRVQASGHDAELKGESGHFYLGENRTSVSGYYSTTSDTGSYGKPRSGPGKQHGVHRSLTEYERGSSVSGRWSVDSFPID